MGNDKREDWENDKGGNEKALLPRSKQEKKG